MRPRNVIATQRREGTSGEGPFFKQVIAELRRATWPSREEAVRLTIMVLAIAGAMGFFLWLADTVFDFLMRTVFIGA